MKEYTTSPFAKLKDIIVNEYNLRWVKAEYGQQSGFNAVTLLEEVMADMNKYVNGLLEYWCPVCGGVMWLTKDCDTYYFECYDGCCVSTDSGESPMEAFMILSQMKCYSQNWIGLYENKKG